MTTKKTLSRPPAPRQPTAPSARAFERQAPPAPRLQPLARDGHPADPAEDARPADPPAALQHRSARDVILRLVETLKEL
jgi:hypothetical protein